MSNLTHKPETCDRCDGQHLDPAREGFTYGCEVIRHADSHVDHDVSEAQLAWIIERASEHLLLFTAREPAPPILKLTLQLPYELGTVPCGLHGPQMGDEPVLEPEVSYAVRGKRGGESRLVERPVRQVRKISLIAGEHDGHRWVLFTTFGGPIAPREPFDAQGDERAESEAYWAEHALSKGAS